jgi:DNA mismatch repair ATPase MutS
MKRGWKVLMDEIGRGSAGDDGTALAHAVIELVLSKRARALFATHFHHIAPLLGFENKAKGLIPAQTPREGVAFTATDVVEKPVCLVLLASICC